MRIFRGNKPVAATDKAKAALGVSPGTEAVRQALSLAEITPPPAPTPEPPKSVIPSDPGAHLRYAQRAVEQMNDEEKSILAEIEQENAAHAAKIETLEGQLAGVRKTRAFYAGAPIVLADPAPEAVAADPDPKPSRRAAKAEKPEGQEAAHE